MFQATTGTRMATQSAVAKQKYLPRKTIPNSPPQMAAPLAVPDKINHHRRDQDAECKHARQTNKPMSRPMQSQIRTSEYINYHSLYVML
jgi:hypothetical protein